MPLSSVLGAADMTPDGRHAIRAAAQLAAVTGARLTVVEVVRVGGDGAVPIGRVASSRDPRGRTDELATYQHWIGAIDPPSIRQHTEVAVAYGVAGIEIGRLADQRAADLVVLGRRPRSTDHPLMLGETADALVRRSPRPALFVPAAITMFRRVLVALDGTERTINLLGPACSLATAWGAELTAITVRPTGVNGDDVKGRLQALLGRAAASLDPRAITVRTGNPIDEVLAELELARPDVLVIGYRRGGPPKVIGPADIARNLLYAAPTAVLTIPL